MKKSEIFEMGKCSYCEYELPNLELETYINGKRKIKICQTCRENFEAEFNIAMDFERVSSEVFNKLKKFCK